MGPHDRGVHVTQRMARNDDRPGASRRLFTHLNSLHGSRSENDSGDHGTRLARVLIRETCASPVALNDKRCYRSQILEVRESRAMEAHPVF